MGPRLAYPYTSISHILRGDEMKKGPKDHCYEVGVGVGTGGTAPSNNGTPL